MGSSKEYGYHFVIFDSDGDGAKDDIAKLTCLGMSGGYGSFRLEVFVSGKNYTKVFDSDGYVIDGQTYKKLSVGLDGELMIDTVYSVEACDTDNDGSDELVCRQYAWVECHADHIGDVASVFKVVDHGLEIIDVKVELFE